MKKLISIVMVMALILAMGIPVFAAETGSITITNVTVGQKYSVHKIFDASIKLGSGGETEAVAYSLEPTSETYKRMFEGTDPKGANYFIYNASTKEIRKKEGVNDTDLISYLTSIIEPCSCGGDAAAVENAYTLSGSEETVTWEVSADNFTSIGGQKLIIFLNQGVYGATAGDEEFITVKSVKLITK